MEVLHKRDWLKAYNKKRFLGKLKLLDLDQPGAYISHLSVKEPLRNLGYGSSLLSIAISYAKIKGCGAVSLHCAISNIGALRFYERHGFFIVATTVDASFSAETGIKERHYMMAKKI